MLGNHPDPWVRAAHHALLVHLAMNVGQVGRGGRRPYPLVTRTFRLSVNRLV